MKKFSIFIVLLLLVSMFNACEEETTNLLLGEWGWVSATYVRYEDGVQVETGTQSEPFFLYIEILKGGTGTIYFDAVDSEAFTWEKDGKTLTIDKGTVNEMVETIKTLTKTTLVIEVTDTYDDDGTLVKTDTTITLVKIP